MSTLINNPTAQLLASLHQQADRADNALKQQVMAAVAASGKTLETFFAEKIARDKSDFKSGLRGMANHFLAVSPEYGRFLYMCARALKARRIVEFGTSMGISTIYLAAALRDNGGGRLIGSEIEPAKVTRAGDHIKAAGLADLVEIRAGNALETLQEMEGDVDLLLLDGAFALYVPVLKLIEPRLRNGALVLAENALDRDYLDYVRTPANGYLSQEMNLGEARGNEFTVVVR